MDRTVCIIGIGERSALVNQRIRSEMDSDDQERVSLLTVDYSRDEDVDFAGQETDTFLLDRSLGLILYRQEEEFNADFQIDGFLLPEKFLYPLYKQIDNLIDSLSKYKVSSSRKIPRIILHTCLNQDHPAGIQNAIGEYYNAGRSQAPKPMKPRSNFSKLFFFETLRILEEVSKKRKVKIDIFPVVLLRTAFFKDRDLLEREKIKPLIQKLGEKTESNEFFKIGYIVQDTNSRANSINTYEHISLLYLHVLVLSNITNSVKELGIWNNLTVRNVLFETSPEVSKSRQKWCSLGFVDGVLQFKTYKTKFAKFLVKESLEYILKEEETDVTLSRDNNSSYSSTSAQLLLESVFLSLLNEDEEKTSATADSTIQRFHEKVNSHDEVFKKQSQNHNLEDIRAGKDKNNKKFSEYLDSLENLPTKGKEIRELPAYWLSLVEESKVYIQRIRDMAKDFLQPTRMREMDAHVKSITVQMVHDFRLFCTTIASGDSYKPDNQEFYNKELDTVIHRFFLNTKPNYTWKYLRESLKKVFSIFQYDVYNPSLSKVNESVRKVEELKNYDLSQVRESIESNRIAIERTPSKKSIFFLVGIFILGISFINLKFLSPVPYLEIHSYLGRFSAWIVKNFLPSSGFYFAGWNFQFQDTISLGILILAWFTSTGLIVLYYRARLHKYKNRVEGSVRDYRQKVMRLFKEMFGINLNLKLSGFLMEYINEIEKSFIKLNDFESKSREMIVNLEHSLTELYDSYSDEDRIGKENLNMASFMGIHVHPNQEFNSILVSLLSINIQEDLNTIRNSIKYQVDDTNRIKKYLLRFDRSIEENFQEFNNELEKSIHFDSIESLSRDWKFTKVPPNVQAYIPLKVYTSDFHIDSFPYRDYKEITLGDMNDYNSFEDHHILTIFYPIRKFTFQEIQAELYHDIDNSISEVEELGN